MTTSPLTSRQKEILEFLSSIIQRRGYPPSLREIAEHFDIAGVRAVEKHILALERKGYLRKGAGARALELVGHGQGRSVPILGKVAAGEPILAQENLLGSLMVDPSLSPRDAYFTMVEGEATVKRLIKRKRQYVLMPEKPDFDPIVLTEKDSTFQILGKVISVIRLTV